MKPFCLVLLCGTVLVLPVVLRGEDDSTIPHAWPITRYEQLKGQVPFALATPVEPKVVDKAGFAANWYISGIAHLDGENFVTIKARDLSTEFSLYGQEAVNGVSLASIEWSEKIGKSIVIIKRGSETARLEFNEAEATGPAKVTSEPPGQKGPGINGISNAPLVNYQPKNGPPPSAIRTISNLPPTPHPPNGLAPINPNAQRPPIGESRIRQTLIKAPGQQ